jgi:magnesium transporter
MAEAAMEDERLHIVDLRGIWRILTPDERVEAFHLLARDEAEDFFLGLPTIDAVELMRALPRTERRTWMRLLPLDDAADLIQHAPEEEREGLLGLLDDATRKEVNALLAYAQDAAGGLMNPRYARLRPEMTVDEAIGYLRRQARTNLETLNYLYVLDDQQRLLGVVSFRELFAAQPDRTVRDAMVRDVI